MTNRIGTAVAYLALICLTVISGLRSGSADDTCVSCIDPAGTPIPTCTPTVEPTMNPYKGEAGFDGGCTALDTLGISQWYSWRYGNDNPCDDNVRYQMVRDGLDYVSIITGTLVGGADPSTLLNSDTKFVLVLNEPGKSEPAGCDMTIDQEVLAIHTALGLFPPSDGWKLIVGGYSQDNYTRAEAVWAQYANAYGAEPEVHAVAFHCYIFDGYDALCRQVADYYSQFAQDHGIETWCTETASMALTGTSGVNWGTAVAGAEVWLDYLESLGIPWFWYPYGFPPQWTSKLVEVGDGGEITPTLLGEVVMSR